jgi:hypothetical protein
MSQPLIVHGRYIGRTFIPDGPLPEAEGVAELVITPAVLKSETATETASDMATDKSSDKSIVESFGTASVLRTAEEILAQVRSDRDAWGDR